MENNIIIICGETLMQNGDNTFTDTQNFQYYSIEEFIIVVLFEQTNYEPSISKFYIKLLELLGSDNESDRAWDNVLNQCFNNNEALAYIVYNHLDKLGLIDSVVSVRYSWLNIKGKSILHALQIHC